MKKILGFKGIASLTALITILGGLLFTVGFGSCLLIARQEVTKEVEKEAKLAISHVQGYVDDQLQRVTDVANTLLSCSFSSSRMPSEEDMFRILEQVLDANPHLCGIAMGFEPSVYPGASGQYGFAAYVTNVSGSNERLQLGKIHDFRSKPWYNEVSSRGGSYWIDPFKETSKGKVVACYGQPLHSSDGRFIGVLALDIDTEAFRQKCTQAAPFPEAKLTIVDKQFRFLAHPDTTFLLRSVAEVGAYDDYVADDSMRIQMYNRESGNYLVNKGTDREAMFYFAPIERTGWMVSVECPKKAIYGGVDRMKRTTSLIGFISILLMLLSLLWLFRKLQETSISKAGIESELKIASGIQMSMIPKLYPAFPERREIDVYGFLKPAKSVGGDLYDYFIKDNKFFFCIGDVSGKGVPAALYMAVVRALFRNISLHCDNPAEIVSALNDALSEGNDYNMFCTMFLGVLDLADGHLEYCNAGHNRPVIRRVEGDGKTMKVDYADVKVNIAVGVFEGFSYEKESTDLLPGEAVFLYTDGVTEAENRSKTLFGDEAALAALSDARRHNVHSTKEFVEYVYTEVRKYADGAEQNDDITMLVVEYNGDRDMQ